MAYLTTDELKAALDETYVAQLTDDDQGLNVDASKGASTSVLTEIVDDASSMCDLYLSKQYACPLTTVPKSVKRLATKIAVYMLHERRSWTISDKLKASYDDAISMLKMLSESELRLPGLSFISDGAFDADDREYTRTTLEAFG